MKYAIVGVTLLGAYLRFYNLGVPPFWVDEVLLVRMASWNKVFQEFIPIYLIKIFNLRGEFWIRFVFALAGTLTIPAIYHVLKDKELGLCAAILVSTFPLFVYWSRMARPYALAGLFVVLAWKYGWALIPAVLTTPFALVGIDIFRIGIFWKIYVFAAMIVIGSFMVRSDTKQIVGTAVVNNLSLDFFIYQTRMYYVPLLVAILYCFEYLVPYVLNRHPTN